MQVANHFFDMDMMESWEVLEEVGGTLVNSFLPALLTAFVTANLVACVFGWALSRRKPPPPRWVLPAQVIPSCPPSPRPFPLPRLLPISLPPLPSIFPPPSPTPSSFPCFLLLSIVEAVPTDNSRFA
jgi:hypothetical protein